MVFYDIVFFLSPEAEAAGAKVSLIAGQYVITKAPATTIQALHFARPPVDQSAEVAALTAQVEQLTADLAACQAGAGMPTISGMTVQPSSLPAGGGNVQVDAVVTDAVAVMLDGVQVTLPVTVPVTADHTFTLVAVGPSAQAQASVAVAALPPAPVISNMTITPANLPVGGGPVVIDATVTGVVTSLKLDGVPVTLPATVNA